MTDKMLKFVKIGQQTPPKRKVGNRKKDFNEIQVISIDLNNSFTNKNNVYFAMILKKL